MGRPPSMLRIPSTTDQLPGRPLAQEYFKQDIGVASPSDVVATSQAKRPDEFERVIVAAVLIESSVKPILRAPAHAPIPLPERQLISTYRWNKVSARLALGHRTPEGR
jgi:hypothetical protein